MDSVALPRDVFLNMSSNLRLKELNLLISNVPQYRKDLQVIYDVKVKDLVHKLFLFLIPMLEAENSMLNIRNIKNLSIRHPSGNAEIVNELIYRKPKDPTLLYLETLNDDSSYYMDFDGAFSKNYKRIGLFSLPEIFKMFIDTINEEHKVDLYEEYLNILYSFGNLRRGGPKILRWYNKMLEIKDNLETYLRKNPEILYKYDVL